MYRSKNFHGGKELIYAHEFAQQPIIISCGYRCNALNIKVGGAYANLHKLGEATDIQIPKTAYTNWDDNKAHTDKEFAK